MKKSKLFRKVISIVMCITILAQVVVVTGAEETDSKVVTADVVSVANKLVTLGVLDENNVKPEGSTVTRAEFIDIAVDYFQLEPYLKTPETTYFYDVPVTHDSIRSINCFHEFGYVNGDGNGYLRPDENITLTEALTIILRAAGYGAVAKRKGSYPSGYFMVANEYDLLDDVNTDSGALLAGNLYKLLDNCCEMLICDAFPVTDDLTHYVLNEGDTVLWVLYKIKVNKGIVTANNYTTLTAPNSKSINQMVINNEKYVVGDDSFSDLLGMNVKYYTNEEDRDEKILVYAEPLKNEIQRIMHDDIVSANKYTVTYMAENNKKDDINIDTGYDVIYNGVAYTGFGTIDKVMPKNGHIEFLDNDYDGDADVIFVREYKDIVIGDIDVGNERIYDKLSGEVFDLAPQYAASIIELEDGSRANFAQLEEGDVVSVFESKNTSGEKLFTLLVSKNEVSGKIVAVEDDYYIIDGTTYKKSKQIKQPITIGLNGTFLLNNFDEIVMYSGDFSSMSFAAIRGIEEKKRDTVEVRLFTADGTFQNYTINKSIVVDGKKEKIDDATFYSSFLTRFVPGEIIQYRLNDDGELAEIKFADESPDAKSVFSVLEKWSSFSYYSNSFNGKFFVDGNTKIFNIPADKTAEEDYAMVIASQITTKMVHGNALVAYYMGDTRLKPVCAVRIEGDLTLNNKVKETTPLAVLSEMSTGILDDETVTYIYAMSNKRNLKLCLTNKIKNKLETKFGYALNLMPGTVFRYISDADYNITDLEIVYNGTAHSTIVPPTLPDDMILENTNTFYTSGRMLYAIVNEVRDDIISYTVPYPPGSDGTVKEKEEIFGITSTTTITKYYTESGKVEMGYAFDLNKGDVVIMLVAGGPYLRDIVVFK